MASLIAFSVSSFSPWVAPFNRFLLTLAIIDSMFCGRFSSSVLFTDWIFGLLPALFASIRKISVSSQLGILGLIADGLGGVCSACALPYWMAEPPKKGNWPVNISNMVTPRQYTSVSVHIFPYSVPNCSGLMYCGVPTISPVVVMVRPALRFSSASRLFTEPKSMSFTMSFSSTIRLEGLMSLCTRPYLCTASRASVVWDRMLM